MKRGISWIKERYPVNPSSQAIFLIYIDIIDMRTESRSGSEKWYLGVS
jgi:hypothetical protein